MKSKKFLHHQSDIELSNRVRSRAKKRSKTDAELDLARQKRNNKVKIVGALKAAQEPFKDPETTQKGLFKW